MILRPHLPFLFLAVAIHSCGVLFSSQLRAQTPRFDLRFAHYTDAHGLSQNTVLCALQDRRGFMWFGTQDGLNRFDGYTFRAFKHDPDNANSLSENWIWSIYEDRRGYLWIATFGGGVNRFDPETETFVSFRHAPRDSTSLSHDTVWAFYENAAGELYVAANNGLNRFHAESQTFSYYAPPTAKNNVFHIVARDDNTLWLSTLEAVLAFDMTTRQFTVQLTARELNMNFSRGAMARDANGALWLGTDKGLVQFDPNTRRLQHYKPDSLHGLPHAIVTSIHADRSGALWIGTREGLALRRAHETAFEIFRHDPLDRYSLTHSFIFSIYAGRTGEVWIGTRSGLNRCDPEQKKFRHYRAAPNAPHSLSHRSVLPILVSRRENNVLWLGTNNGLNRLDLATGEYRHFFHQPNNVAQGPAGNYILSLLEDRRGNLWIGTRGSGLSRMTVDARGMPRFTHFRHSPQDTTTLGSNTVHSLYEDRAGELWIGTGGGGLNRFEAAPDVFKRYEANNASGLRDSFVYAMLEDTRGEFWLGTSSGGLHTFDRARETFTQFAHAPQDRHSLSNNRVLCLFESARDSSLWIGTAAGLNKLLRSGDEIRFQQFRERDGLPNEVIYGILEDEAGRLWVSTNRGLCRLHFENGELRVRAFTVDDGLQSNEFSQNAYQRGPTGEMFFGGINGFNAFHPDSVRDHPRPPAVVITDFKILNQTVRLGRLEPQAPLALSYKDLFFSIEFAALNFTLPEKNQYAYMMEGFDADWIPSGGRRIVTYTNLDAGAYTFRVKASNHDGVWNEEGAALQIVIAPPPWRTWWAYALYVALGAGGIFGVIRLRLRAQARQMEAQAAIARARQEERERVRKKSSADFHDEAGHLLTKITLFTAMARREAGPTQSEYFEKIEAHTKTLAGRMRDFIWALDPEKDSLHDALLRLKDFGSALFEASDVQFRAYGLTEPLAAIPLAMEDRRELVLIFKEAMHNCLKHARCQTVTLEAALQNGELALTLTDDGAGFDAAAAHEGYGLRNMCTRAQKIGGALEILSQPGNTVVRFRKKLHR
jgi:ligand-binding sensor domain-containing protein/signal transduction histidine kinase